MRKSSVLFLSLAASLSAALAFGSAKPIEVSADSIEASSEVAQSAEESAAPAPAHKYLIKEAYIGFRDSEAESYGKGGAEIGSYFLSADGWDDDAEDIVMTVKGNVTTKLDNKVLYVYEYKPTMVKWAGNEIPQQEDKTYLLAKPAEEGEYDLEIYFTKTLITNPVELTKLNWSSFLTVQNLMTIISWAVITVGIIVIYAINTRYKKKGVTTVQEMKEFVTDKLDNAFGAEMAAEFSKLLDGVIGKTFAQINAHLAKTDDNMSVLLRCLLLMQENTPEARLAITDLLTKLQTEEDGKAAEVSALIKAEMEKYKADEEAKRQAIENAEKLNEQWKKKAEEAEPEPEPEPKEDKGDDYGKL